MCSWPCQDGRRVMTPGDRMGVGPVRPQNRPDKKQGEGFSWVECRSTGICSLAPLLLVPLCFCFPFPIPFPPQMRLLSPVSNCAWFFAGLSDSRVVHDKQASENFRYFSTFSCSNPVFWAVIAMRNLKPTIAE